MATASKTSDTVPAFHPIELVAAKDSKITSVSVYTGRAEITRLFKFNVKDGQNQLSIVGLPAVLDKDSFRVEGRGAATIHDVTLSTIVPPTPKDTSPELAALLLTKKQNEKANARCIKALRSLETYMTSLKAESLEVSKLREVVQNYEAAASELDDKVTELEEERQSIEKAIKEEQDKLHGPTGSEKLNVKAIVGVFADSEGEIDISLIYAVSNATWNAGYDIRVNMQTEDKPIALVYKGSISQDTGEDWEDVPLTLETATPTFAVGVPTLSPWTISANRPVMFKKGGPRRTSSMLGGSAPMASMARSRGMPQPMVSAPAPETSSVEYDEYASPASIGHRELQVSSKGNISATFVVPGLINIPSDNIGHNVTIVKLALEAEMSWVCVPKKDSRVHLKAKIKNASDYTLLGGAASVYVDGSFIARSDVPLVSPEEKFECPLGLDPSIRVTYHPRSKKVSHSGFYTKSSNHTFTQRITVHNTKPTVSSKNLSIKVIDQVPVSEDSVITVKLVQPALTIPTAEGTASITSVKELKAPAPVKVGTGVIAMWDGADEVGQGEIDVESLGKEGRFAWVCSVPPQGKVGLTLQWEVTAPTRTIIHGL